MLQNRLAAERCSASGPGDKAAVAKLNRIIWLPEGVTGERAEQQAFIDALQRDAALQYGADLLRGDIEGLKGAMHQSLRGIAASPQPQSPPPRSTPVEETPASEKTVHVVMSEADRVGAVPLLKLLRAHGLQVSLPVFVGDAAALREANTQLRSDADALILFYGAGDEVWKFHQQSELRKQAATTMARSRRAVWTCLALPSTADKELLQQLGDPLLFDARAGWSVAALQPLLTALASASISAPAPTRAVP
jgi:hypothetical protein